MIKYPVTKTDGQVAELWSDKYPCCISSLNFGTGFDRQGATTPRQLADSVDLNSLVDILNDSRAAEIDREKVLEGNQDRHRPAWPRKDTTRTPMSREEIFERIVAHWALRSLARMAIIVIVLFFGGQRRNLPRQRRVGLGCGLRHRSLFLFVRYQAALAKVDHQMTYSASTVLRGVKT
jgi:hypothetical protein